MTPKDLTYKIANTLGDFMRMFSEILADVATEEELKNFFAKYFRIKLSTKNYIDLYTAQILFEFKFDAGRGDFLPYRKIFRIHQT